MKQFEQNIMQSFRMCKNDIMRVHQEVLELSKAQEKILEIIEELRKNQERLNARVSMIERKPTPKAKTTKVVKVVEKKVKSTKKSKHFWASKTGKKFHDTHCPFAKNIKPKSRVVYKSKNTALNKGLKPCKCV